MPYYKEVIQVSGNILSYLSFLKNEYAHLFSILPGNHEMPPPTNLSNFFICDNMLNFEYEVLAKKTYT